MPSRETPSSTDLTSLLSLGRLLPPPPMFSSSHFLKFLPQISLSLSLSLPSVAVACEAIRTWSISSLVGAFLDLAIAYLLLCCSTLAFFAAKFLAFFGFPLPCPCNGLFGDPYAHQPCLQQLVVDAPVRRIAGVHAYVRSRFPFDSIWNENPAAGTRPPLNAVKFAVEEGRRGLLELPGGEESCSSLSEARDLRSSTSTLSRARRMQISA